MRTNRRKMYYLLLILVLIITFCFCESRLWQIFFVHPKSVKVEYETIIDLKEEKGLGFILLLPEHFILAKKKDSIIAYRTENNRIVFIMEKNRPDLFTKKLSKRPGRDFEFYNRIFTNKWRLDYLILKYLVLSKWRTPEIEIIEINDFKGFLVSGEKKDQKSQNYYLYEFFDKSYRLTIAVRVNKEESFGEKEINYIISKINIEKEDKI